MYTLLTFTTITTITLTFHHHLHEPSSNTAVAEEPEVEVQAQGGVVQGKGVLGERGSIGVWHENRLNQNGVECCERYKRENWS